MIFSTLSMINFFLILILGTIGPIESISESIEGHFLRGNDNDNHNENDNDNHKVEKVEHEMIASLAERMRPRDIDKGTLIPEASPPAHQFFHLHHMKSGGTSLSSWISCGKSRMDVHLATAGLSECGWGSYHRCIENESDGCRKRIDNAVVMNYCSPLAVTNYFNWTDADAVTMMRHPGEYLYLVLICIYIYICCWMYYDICYMLYEYTCQTLYLYIHLYDMYCIILTWFTT